MILPSKALLSDKFHTAKKIIITFHGYGATGDDFLEVGEILFTKRFEDTVFLFPDAIYECDIGFGRQWFALEKTSYKHLQRSLEEASPIVFQYIQAVEDEYNCKDINLIGFSQGAMIALDMIHYCRNISKIVAYAGAIVANKNGSVCASNANVLLIHSNDDQIVPYKNALLAQKYLDSYNIKNDLLTFSGIQHSISVDGWEYGIKFLNS
jgi:phospholipase/carboxylesterase